MKTIFISDISKLLSIDTLDRSDEAILYVCSTGIADIFLHRLIPPAGKYFLEVKAYPAARYAMAEITIRLDSDNEISNALNDLLETNGNYNGFGLFESDYCIDIFAPNNEGIGKYFLEQIKSFEMPFVSVPVDELCTHEKIISTLIDALSTMDGLQSILRHEQFDKLLCDEGLACLPGVISLSPRERSPEECLLLLAIIEKLNAPSFYNLLVAYMEDIDPFTGGELGLKTRFYSGCLNKETCLYDEIQRVARHFCEYYPVIAKNPLSYK